MGRRRLTNAKGHSRTAAGHDARCSIGKVQPSGRNHTPWTYQQVFVRGSDVSNTGQQRLTMSGTRAIKEAGGTTIVQDPVHSDFRLMPDSAVATGCVDLVLPVSEIGAMLSQLCMGATKRA